MTDIFSKSITERNTLSPEVIISRLSFFYEQTHELHFNSKSFAEHSALNYYSSLIDFKDRIGELLLGYIAPKRFGQIPSFRTSPNLNSLELMNEIIKFSHQLEEYADKNKLADLCNVAQELEGSAVKVKYLLTLS